MLYGKEDLLNRMPPWQGGGEMIKEVHFEKTTYNELPFKFEAGTPDFIGVIGLGEAIRYVESVGLPEIAVYEQQLLDYAMERKKSGKPNRRAAAKHTICRLVRLKATFVLTLDKSLGTGTYAK